MTRRKKSKVTRPQSESGPVVTAEQTLLARLRKIAIVAIEGVAATIALALFSCLFTPWSWATAVFLAATLGALACVYRSYFRLKRNKGAVAWSGVAMLLSVCSGLLPFFAFGAPHYVMSGKELGFSTRTRSIEIGISVDILRDPLRIAAAPFLASIGGAVLLERRSGANGEYIVVPLDAALADPIIDKDHLAYPGHRVYQPDPQVAHSCSMLPTRLVFDEVVGSASESDSIQKACSKVRDQYSIDASKDPERTSDGSWSVEYPFGLKLSVEFQDKGVERRVSGRLRGSIRSGAALALNRPLYAYMEPLPSPGAPSWNWVRIEAGGDEACALYAASLHWALRTAGVGDRQLGIEAIEACRRAAPGSMERCRISCMLARASHNALIGNVGSLQVAYYATQASRHLLQHRAESANPLLYAWCQEEIARWSAITGIPDTSRGANVVRAKGLATTMGRLQSVGSAAGLDQFLADMMSQSRKLAATKGDAIRNRVEEADVAAIAKAAGAVAAPSDVWIMCMAMVGRALRKNMADDAAESSALIALANVLVAKMGPYQTRGRRCMEVAHQFRTSLAGIMNGQPVAAVDLATGLGINDFTTDVLIERVRAAGTESVGRWHQDCAKSTAALASAVAHLIDRARDLEAAQAAAVYAKLLRELVDISERASTSNYGVWLVLACAAEAAEDAALLARAVDKIRDATAIPWPRALYLLNSGQ